MRRRNEKARWLVEQDAYIDALRAEGADPEILVSAVGLRRMVIEGRMRPPV